MGWGAEQIALAVVGALFLLGVAASLHPPFAVSPTSRIVLAAAAGAYVAAAIAVSSVEPALWWLVSLSVAVAVTRDVVSHRHLHGVHLLPLRRRVFSTHRDAPGPIATAQPEPSAEVRSRIDRATDPATSSAELEEIAYTVPEARRAVASHAATPASVLSWLASYGDDTVVAAIVARQKSADTTAFER